MMQSHVRFDSRIYQTSSCLQHGIIPLAIFHSQLRFLLCVVDADCHASVLTDHELRAVGCDSVRVGHDGEPQIQIPWAESEESQFTFHAGFQTMGSRRILLLDAYDSVAPSFGRVGGSNASTRSSSLGIPSTFEMNSMPMAVHRESACRSVYVNRMTGVSGKTFFRTVAASAPFTRGIARSRSIKSGFDFLAFSIASMPSNASRTTISLCRP